MNDAITETRKTCVLCGESFAAFLRYGIPPRTGQCPACGCKGRHRALALFARRRLLPRLGPGREVLEIGATPRLLPRVARLWGERGARYTAIDLFEPARAVQLRAPDRFLIIDARRMDFADASFDLVLCSNVLSFVREADAILAEVRRALKPGGLAVLTVHRVAGPTRSSADYSRDHGGLTPEYLRENGSEWFFGDDYPELLRRQGLESVDVARPAVLDEAAARALGLEKQPTLTLAARSAAALKDWLGEVP